MRLMQVEDSGVKIEEKKGPRRICNFQHPHEITL